MSSGPKKEKEESAHKVAPDASKACRTFSRTVLGRFIVGFATMMMLAAAVCVVVFVFGGGDSSTPETPRDDSDAASSSGSARAKSEGVNLFDVDVPRGVSDILSAPVNWVNSLPEISFGGKTEQKKEVVIQRPKEGTIRLFRGKAATITVNDGDWSPWYEIAETDGRRYYPSAKGPGIQEWFPYLSPSGETDSFQPLIQRFLHRGPSATITVVIKEGYSPKEVARR